MFSSFLWGIPFVVGATGFPNQPLYARAQAGDADAQNKVGEIYANGKGVTQDYSEARKWFRKAAKKGNNEAWKNIGWTYAFGQGVPRNYLKAFYWFRKSAEHGNVEAQFYLGLFFETGRGVDKNPKEAKKWYEKAASQRHLFASKALERLRRVDPEPDQAEGPENEDRP